MPLGKWKAASRKQSPGTAMSQQKNKRNTGNTHMAWKNHASTCLWGKPVRAAAATNYKNTWAITEWNQLNLPQLQPMAKVRGSTSRQCSLDTGRQLYIRLKGGTEISIGHRNVKSSCQHKHQGQYSMPTFALTRKSGKLNVWSAYWPSPSIMVLRVFAMWSSFSQWKKMAK